MQYVPPLRPLPPGAWRVYADPDNLREPYSTMPANDLPLGDIRVLDLSEEADGSFCTKILAGLGAEVIKVEPPGSGDVSRRAGPFAHNAPYAEQSAAFLYLNTGKKSLTLDITTPTGTAILRRLVQAL